MTTDTFTYARQTALPPARMWPLITNSEMRQIWGSPDDTATLTTLYSDLRVGGTDHQRCGPADAPEFESCTRWYHLSAPDTAVYTEVIEAGGMALGASLVTITLTAEGTGTRMDVTVAVSSFVGAEMIGEFRSGWDGSMANLDQLIAKHS